MGKPEGPQEDLQVVVDNMSELIYFFPCLCKWKLEKKQKIAKMRERDAHEQFAIQIHG